MQKYKVIHQYNLPRGSQRCAVIKHAALWHSHESSLLLNKILDHPNSIKSYMIDKHSYLGATRYINHLNPTYIVGWLPLLFFFFVAWCIKRRRNLMKLIKLKITDPRILQIEWSLDWVCGIQLWHLNHRTTASIELMEPADFRDLLYQLILWAI